MKPTTAQSAAAALARKRWANLPAEDRKKFEEAIAQAKLQRAKSEAAQNAVKKRPTEADER